MCAEGQRLAKLTRGRSLVLPELRFDELADVSASVRLRLERRVRAFARDWVGRLLAPVRELARSDIAALRAVAYQLEAGLGTALRETLEPTLALLGPAELARLGELGIAVGRLSLVAASLATTTARAERALLVSVFHAPAGTKSTLPAPPCPRGALSPETWLALDALVLGPWVLRSDLAERAAVAVAEGENPERLLGSLGVPKRERARVSAAILKKLSLRKDARTGIAEEDARSPDASDEAP